MKQNKQHIGKNNHSVFEKNQYEFHQLLENFPFRS